MSKHQICLGFNRRIKTSNSAVRYSRCPTHFPNNNTLYSIVRCSRAGEGPWNAEHLGFQACKQVSLEPREAVLRDGILFQSSIQTTARLAITVYS